jgi:hypothetical protein
MIDVAAALGEQVSVGRCHFSFAAFAFAPSYVPSQQQGIENSVFAAS